jgi:23S rRNA (guanosine2251-2'-O)-methyltransferase
MKKDLIVIAHNIRSTYNVGSLFRTCDAAGASELILGGYTAGPEHPKVLKTALGAERFVPWKKVKATWREIERLKKEGYQICALELSKESKDIFKFIPRFPCALVVGNEKTGLSKEIMKRCDKVLAIPMRGNKESLNVVVAAGVAMYRILE